MNLLEEMLDGVVECSVVLGEQLVQLPVTALHVVFKRFKILVFPPANCNQTLGLPFNRPNLRFQ